MPKIIKIAISLGVLLLFGSLVVGGGLYYWEKTSLLPKSGWWNATLKLDDPFEGHRPCAAYTNIKEKTFRFRLHGGLVGYSLEFPPGNFFKGADEGSSAIDFDNGKESFSLGYTRTNKALLVYMPDANELKSLKNRDSCFTRYSGQAEHD